MEHLWSILFFSILSTVILIFLILLINDFYDYINKSSTKIIYPYKLYIKPLIVETNENISISLSKITESNSINNISLIIIDPSSTPFILNINEGTKQDELLINKSFHINGNYSLVLFDNIKNNILTTSTFKVQSFYMIILNFIFGQGIGFFIGIIVPFLTILLQRGIKLRDDNVQRLTQKSQWMSSNMKYYLDTSSKAGNISNYFETHETDYNNPDLIVEEFIPLLINFYKSYIKTQEHVGVSYFGSSKEEDFVRKLAHKVIMTIRDDIFNSIDIESFIKGQNNSLNLYPSIPIGSKDDVVQWFSQNIIVANNSIQKISDLNKDNNIKKFYSDLLLFSWILSTVIHNGMVITYNNPKKENKVYFQSFSKYKDIIQDRLIALNDEFFNASPNDSKYYDFLSQFTPRWQEIKEYLTRKTDFRKSYRNLPSHSYIILLSFIISLTIANIVIVVSGFQTNRFYIINIIVILSSLIVMIILMAKIKRDLYF